MWLYCIAMIKFAHGEAQAQLENQKRQQKRVEQYYKELHKQFIVMEKAQAQLEQRLSAGEIASNVKEINTGGFSELPPVVKAVALSKLTELIDEISIEVDWSIPKLEMKELEIVALFSNLLDNAIVACQKSGMEKPIIVIKGRLVNKGIEIVMENSIDNADESIETVITTLANTNRKENHGYGLHIIEDIVGKYGGAVCRKAENKIFYTTISI